MNDTKTALALLAIIITLFITGCRVTENQLGIGTLIVAALIAVACIMAGNLIDHPACMPEKKEGERTKAIPAHNEVRCGLVEKRIACDECGYPASEARYCDVEEWLVEGNRLAKESKGEKT